MSGWAQVDWNTGGNNINGAEWFGAGGTSTVPLRLRTIPDLSIDFSTSNLLRARLCPVQTSTIGGFQNINQHGFLGLSGHANMLNNAGPFTRLHLADVSGAAIVNAQQFAFRPWQRNGVTFTGNADHGYVGQKYSGTDTTDMVILWSNDAGLGLFAPDHLTFRFATRHDSTRLSGAFSMEGLEAMRMFPLNDSSAFVGVGDFWRATVANGGNIVEPSERLDVLDRTIRIRRLIPDYQNDTLEHVVVADTNGRLHWRDIATWPVASECEWQMNTAAPNHVFTAYSATADPDCPDDAEAVGIGIDLGTSSAQAKLGVVSNTFDVGVDVLETLAGSTTTGVRVNSYGGNAQNDGIYVKAQQGSDEGAYNYGVRIDALGDGQNSADWNFGLHAELSGGSYRTRGVSAHTYGGRFTAVAGNFLADDEATYTRGALGYARGGYLRYGVEGRADAGTVGGIDWGAASEIVGLRGYADAGGDATTAYGVYGEASGATTNWAGYFRGDVKVTGTLTVNTTVYTSDAALKTNVSDLSSCLPIIGALQPKSYNFTNDAVANLGVDDAQHVGLIAQELEPVLPGLVHEVVMPALYDTLGNETSAQWSYKGVDYVSLIPYLIGAVKELAAQNASMQQQLAACCASPNDDGTRSTTNGATDEGSITPTQERLLRIAPNPFTDRTTLYYTVERAGRAQLLVNSSDGRELIVLSEAQREAGEYQQVWSTEHLAPGVYHITLLLDGEPLVKRAVKVGR